MSREKYFGFSIIVLGKLQLVVFIKKTKLEYYTKPSMNGDYKHKHDLIELTFNGAA